MQKSYYSLTSSSADPIVGTELLIVSLKCAAVVVIMIIEFYHCLGILRGGTPKSMPVLPSHVTMNFVKCVT